MKMTEELFQSLPIEDRIEIYNRYCERCNYQNEIMRPYKGEDTLNELFEGKTPYEIAKALRECVEFVGTEGWFYFDELGRMWIIETPYLLNDLDVDALSWEDWAGIIEDEEISENAIY